MNIEQLEVESPFGVTLQQPFYRAESATKLMILLPGRGYTVNHPALSYMAIMGAESGYDVLAVQYGFQLTGSLALEQMPLLQEDIDRTVDAVDLQAYSAVCVVGKSLGTPLAVALADRLQAESLILLTPIAAALGAAMPARTLAVIGSADPFYTSDMVAQNPGVHWKVYDDLDHGFLKAGDWAASVSIIADIIGTCAQFLDQA